MPAALVLFALTVFSLASCGSAQPERWGYIDRAGAIRIEPQFQQALEFSEGLAAVRADGKWGYVDVTGRFVIPPRFGSAESFSEGLALVTSVSEDHYWDDETQFGYIDKAGGWVIPEKFNWAASFSEGLAAACIGKCRKTQEALDSRKAGYIDRTGDFLIDPQFTSAGPFSEGLAAIRMGPNVLSVGPGRLELSRSGYIDVRGKLAIPIEHELASRFSFGLAGTRRGYIDRTGALAIPLQSLRADDFSDGLGRVAYEDRTAYYDASGTMVLTAPHAESFFEGMAVYFEQPLFGRARWGFIGKTGKTVLEAKWGHAQRFSEGLAAVCSGCDPFD